MMNADRTRALSAVLLLTLAGMFGCASSAGPTPGLVPSEPVVRSTKNVPTPKLALVVAIGDDGRGWEVRSVDATRTEIFTKIMLSSETVDASTELITQHIVFSRVALPTAVTRFMDGIKTADANVSISATEGPDGSITVQYDSPAAGEASIRRFFQGPDGIYIVAYSARTPGRDIAESMARWQGILAKARLEPNPAAAR